MAHDNPGLTLIDQGKGDDAIAEYRAAVRTDPRYAEAHNNLGAALGRRVRPAEAATPRPNLPTNWALRRLWAEAAALKGRPGPDAVGPGR